MEREMIFTVVGQSPLLTHNPASMQASSAQGKTKRTVSEIPTPEVEAERGLYLDDEGRKCMPGIAFRNAFIKAASSFRGPWQKKRETLKAIVSHCTVREELVPLLDAKGKPMEKYKVDMRRAMVQRNGVTRCRPRFDAWRATFTLLWDDAILVADEDTLRGIFSDVFNDAGKRIGVGDYRPANGGWFGRFQVE